MGFPTSTRSPASTSWALCALYSIIGLFGVLWPLDAMLRGQRGRSWPFEDLSAGDGGAVLVALGGLFLINAVLLDSLMAGKVSDPRAVPGWLRWLRFFSAGVPLIGMYATVAWLWLLENHPRRVLSESPQIGATATSQPPGPAGGGTGAKAWAWLTQRYAVLFSSRAQWLGNAPLFFVGLLAVNILGLQAAIFWWTSFGSDCFALPAGYLLTVPLHGVAFACAASFLLARRRLLVLKPVRRTLVWPLALLWCLPAPYCILGGLVVPVVESAPERSLLARAAYRGRRQWTRSGLEVYSFLRRSVRRWPDDLSPARPAYVRDRLVRLYRVKIALLPVETAAVTAGLIWWADRLQPLGFWVRLGAMSLLAVAGLLAAAGVTAAITVRLSGRDSGTSLHLAYAVAGQATLAAGFYLGILLGSTNHVVFGSGLCDVALLGCLVVAVSGMLRRRRKDTESWAWIGVLLAVALVGFLISLGGPLAVLAAGLLALGTILGPVVSGVVLGPWLLRPLTLAHLGDTNLSSRSRRRQGILATSLILPFGGLMIPFWIYARRRWCPQFETELNTDPQPVTTAEEGRSPTATDTPQRARSERRDYKFLHLISHLANTGKDRRLWTLLEEKSFLAEQARYCRGFRHGSNDLESAVLPATIRLRDWNRFLRYALVAINLRGLADQLTDEGLLEILARHGHPDLALEAAGRVAEASRRLRARTVVGVCLERGDAHFPVLMARLREDLEDLSPPPDEETATRLREPLIGLARAFGPELGPALHRHVAERWPPSHSEGVREEIRIATAWGCLRRADGEPSPELWHALSQVRSPEVLASHLPEIVASLEQCEDPGAILEQVRVLPAAEGEILWLCRAAMLGVLSERRRDTAQTLWDTWRAAGPVPWSADLMVYGAKFFQHLAREKLERIAEDVDDDEARAALWLAVLFGMKESEPRAGAPEEKPTKQVEGLAAIARASIDRLPPDEQPAWLLPWVDALHTFPVAGLETELLRLATRLRRAGYAAPSADLVRFFDLVAVLRPRDLRPWMANAVIASASGSDLLLALAETSRNEAVLVTLLERSERYFLGFSLSTEQTAELWNVVLERLISRLCVLRGNLDDLERGLGLGVSSNPSRFALRRRLVSARCRYVRS